MTDPIGRQPDDVPTPGAGAEAELADVPKPFMREQLRPRNGRGASEPTAAPIRVLFVCTHNSARSVMAKVLLRSRGGQASP